MIYLLDAIIGNDSIKNHVIRWLRFKVIDKGASDPFRRDFNKALYTYSKSKKVRVVGVLIRDTTPDSRDLKSAYARLTRRLNLEIYLSLTAIYLPFPIKSLKDIMRGA